MITYRHNAPLDVHDIVRVFESSGIVRPTTDLPRIERMFAAADVVVSAWSGDVLVGVCRALSDFSYCCYLSDLAVAQPFQGQGIGRRLLAELKGAVGDTVSIVLLAAPGAMSYYPKLGFAALDNGFIIRRTR